MTASNNTMINPYSPSFHFLLLLLLFEPIRLCLSFETSIEGYTSCNNTLFKCGNVTADYPFWGGDRLSGCGHPELKLHCQENISTLDINQVTYRVLHIDGYNKNLRMARNDYYEDELCVSKYVNSTFNRSILELAYGFNYLGIFYECLDYTQSLASCSAYQSSNTNSSVYAAYESLPGCLVRVDVPVGFMNYSYGYGYLEVNEKLKEGFEMRVNVWESAECEACNSSGGKCGYDSESNPTCYCLNGNEDSTKCFATESKNVEKGSETALLKIVLPVAGVSILFLVVLGSFCYIRQHRKIKQLDSESYTKQDLPNSPTTTRSASTKVTSTRTMYFGTHVFSYSELEQATNSFDSSKELGEGGFGTVYYGKLNDGREVAVKRLYERNFKSTEQFMNEVQILARLRHPSLVMLHGCTSRHSRELLLVYEYISNGTLADHLHGNKSNSGSLNWHLRLNIAIETADALAYLHSLDIIHRDVKTTNILIDENFHVKVADFGLSRLFPTNATHVSTAPQGTPGYVDPEYHRCYQLTTKSDVYSFGVVLMELISSKKAVDITRHRHDINLFNMAINRIQNGTLDELVDPQLGFSTDSSVRQEINMVSEMAFLCLQQDTEMRPTMEEVMQSLKNIRNEGLSLITPEALWMKSLNL